ncbi:uncharacterized protein PFL1_00093 [Pseudozyma flocculosa PF-1]|uniref:uncharacterized protein n=1 Tax=Pseudozyma flocculosa PF-1 TaxID=1277687 RepID=UPI0004561B27|nr:uncharacterized protein PFL1_00093 [Pseudozyma flocculosa PF-1]EPQ31894.1 hypothetical protein PFL1_00093 [Pseudozyma flocculosa PF-1]
MSLAARPCTRIPPPRLQPASYRLASTSATPPTPPRSPAPASKQLSPLELPHSYLLGELQRRDYPSFLAHYFYPRHLQTHYLAIRAFNVEVASLKDSVSNELLGQMRMGWWREAIKGAFDNRPAKHPVVLALRSAFHDPAVLSSPSGGLLEDHFLRIISIREADLSSSTTTPSLSELETYAEGTSSRLFYLSLNLLGVSSPVLDELFSHLGKATGLCLALSSLPYHSHPPPSARHSVTKGARKLTLPAETLQKFGVVEEDVFRNGPQAKGFKDAVFDVATRANDYLITARTMVRDEFGGKLPKDVTPALINAVPARFYLDRLQQADFDPYTPSLQAKHWKLPWQMWRASRTRNI